MYTLFINNKLVDLNTDFNVSLNYNTIDITSPVDRNGGFTYSITIPFTRNNNLVFNNINQDIMLDKFVINEFDCTLMFNNSELISGTFFLDNIQNGYVGQIVSNIEWTTKIPELNINELTGFTTNFPLYPTIEDTILWYNNSANTTNSDFVLPFITYGNYNYAAYGQQTNDIQTNINSTLPFSAGTLFSFDDLYPCNYYGNSIKNLFKYMGYQVKSSIFDKITDKIIPYTNNTFKWNWGLIGNVIYDYIDEQEQNIQDYLSLLEDSSINLLTGFGDRSFIPDAIVTTYNGKRIRVRHSGVVNITAATKFTGYTPQLIIGKSDFDFSTLSIIKTEVTGITSTTYSGLTVEVGDYIFVAGPVSGISYLNIDYVDEEDTLNYMRTLPNITCKEYLKNFLNMYNLYPYYNKRNNTIYLYTLDEFIQVDNLELHVSNTNFSKYVNSSISLQYTYDKKDALVVDKEYDYGNNNADNIIKLMFSSTKNRVFRCSDYEFGNDFGQGLYSLPSIASLDQINLDRLDLSISDTIDYSPWLSGTTYDKGDLVSYNELFFTSLVTGNTNNIPNPANITYWIQDFLGNYNTDKDTEYTPRILTYNFDVNKTSGLTGLTSYTPFIQMTPAKSGDSFYLVFQTASFTDDLNLNNVFETYYNSYKGFVNNRTNLVTGTAYIPVDKFRTFFNKPYEVTYLKDTYILLGVSNYNPLTEFGEVKLIKKVLYKNKA